MKAMSSSRQSNEIQSSDRTKPNKIQREVQLVGIHTGRILPLVGLIPTDFGILIDCPTLGDISCLADSFPAYTPH